MGLSVSKRRENCLVGCLFLLDGQAPARRSTLSKGYYHCDLLSSSRYQLLNVPDTRRTKQRWQSVGRSVGPALIGQAGKKNPPI
jgi:hypothetical protein